MAGKREIEKEMKKEEMECNIQALECERTTKMRLSFVLKVFFYQQQEFSTWPEI